MCTLTGTYRASFCAYSLTVFQVPLNYSEPISSSNSASIAIIRTLSPYSPSSNNHKGPLLFNPGGPGGSGVDFMLEEGQVLRTLAGDAFDIISFDPRGTCHLFDLVSLLYFIFQASRAPRQTSRSSPTMLIGTYGPPRRPFSP